MTNTSDAADRGDGNDHQLPSEASTLADILTGRVKRPVHGITSDGDLCSDGGEPADPERDQGDEPMRVRLSGEPVDSKVDEPDILVISTPDYEGGHEAVTEVGVEREIITGKYVSERAGTERHDAYPVYSGIFDPAPSSGAGELPRAITEGTYLQAMGRIDGDDFECAPVTPVMSEYRDCVMWRGRVYRGYEVRFAPLNPDGVWIDEGFNYDLGDFDDDDGVDA